MTKRFEHSIYEFEGFRLDAASLMLYKDAQAVSMPPKAIETLLALIERRGEIIPKDELMATIWTDSIVEESNLSQYLHLLRKILGNTNAGKPFIETLKRRGYRFNGDVTIRFDGFSPQSREDAKTGRNGFTIHNSETMTASARSLRVERHGNVLALADWTESEHAPKPEKAAHADADHHSDFPSKPKSRLAFVVAASLAALLLGTVSIVWFNSAPGLTPPKGDLTFLNLTSGEDVDYATISPDGNYFVYTSRDGDKTRLWLQQTGQAHRSEIVTGFTGIIFGTTFTPDSQFVYFIAGESPGEPGTLYRVPALGGVHAKILTDVSTPVSFSPDGREMVFTRGNEAAGQSSLIVGSSDGTGERILLARSGGDAINSAAWSPDGKLIAYGAVKLAEREGKCTIAAIEPQTGRTSQLSPEKWDNCFRMAWTSDARGLVIAGTKFKEAASTRRDQIYYLSIADGELRRLTTDGSRHQYASLGVTDNDEILAVPYNRFSQIWAMDASGDSRSAVQITRGFADGRSGISPLADGRVAYLTRDGDGFSIWVMNADGSDRRQLTTDPPDIEELRSEADGRFFVFSSIRDGWPHLSRVDSSGGNLTQLTFGESQEVDSTVSPDGNWIVYDSYVFNGTYGKSALWKIPSGGGEPVRLSDSECKTPHFSPDGTSVSCVLEERREISIISFENGAMLNTFQTIENPVLNIGSRWTPDGKALTYIVVDKNVGNVWLQPTDGGKARPLTDFTSGEIYNYAFSTDATRLYLARGYSTRNAVLIRNFR